MVRVPLRGPLAATVVLAASSALASEPAALEELNQGQLGSAFLVALDAVDDDDRTEDDDLEPVDGASYGELTAEASGISRYLPRRWSRLQPTLGLGFEVGAYATQWSAIDLRSQGWLYAPGLEPDVGGSSRSDLQASVDLPLGGLSLDLALEGRLAFSSDADRGVRRYDVAPAPYVDAALAPVLWITGRHHPDEDDAVGVAIDYGGRITRYFGAAPSPGLSDGRTSHRVGVGMGLRDWAEARGTLRWLHLSYARHEIAGAARLHQVDATGIAGEIEFGRSAAGPHGHGRAYVGADAGWSFLWPGFGGQGAVHTPKLRLAIDYRDPEVGRYGGAVHHRAEVAPGGAPVSITSFEAVARIESDEVPVALALLGDFARVEPLPHGSTADVWYVRGDAELYAHLDHVDVGAEGSLGHGLPTGSMGWSPTIAGPRFWGRAGAFVRVHAPF